MPAVAVPEPLRARLRSLEHRNFRLYWWGQLISLVGTWMQSVAQGWLMHRLTDSAFMLGLLGFMQFIPVLFLSLWAGVVADRVDKRKLLYLTQGAAMLGHQQFTLGAGFFQFLLQLGERVLQGFDL